MGMANCILTFSFCLISLILPKFHNHVFNINFILTFYPGLNFTPVYTIFPTILKSRNLTINAEKTEELYNRPE